MTVIKRITLLILPLPLVAVMAIGFAGCCGQPDPQAEAQEACAGLAVESFTTDERGYLQSADCVNPESESYGEEEGYDEE